MKKLKIEEYDAPTPFVNDFPIPERVKIKLKQHVGVSAQATVKIGDMVNKGDLIGDIEEGKLGAKIHASIDGNIIEVSNDYIVIQSK